MSERYRYVPHSYGGFIAGKRYCSVCGLIQLNNPLTDWCVKQGCYNHLHPQYKAMIRRLT